MIAFAEAVACGAKYVLCSCLLDDDHDGPHVCSCRGSWEAGEDGQPRVIAFPGGYDASLEAWTARWMR